MIFTLGEFPDVPERDLHVQDGMQVSTQSAGKRLFLFWFVAFHAWFDGQARRIPQQYEGDEVNASERVQVVVCANRRMRKSRMDVPRLSPQYNLEGKGLANAPSWWSGRPGSRRVELPPCIQRKDRDGDVIRHRPHSQVFMKIRMPPTT